ncbi:MAG TPA: SDR family oxidoreductase [Paenalcaligenes sp.]|nr:SDR family oxidoreductase [Paenalcaligenes sp.]
MSPKISELFDLTGKRALITGSSQGLGWAIAQSMAQQGAHIILNGRNKQQLLDRMQQLRASGYDADIFCQDIAQQQCGQQFKLLCERLGSPHILVNCVGVRLRQSLSGSTDDEIESLLQTNLTSLVLLSRRAALAMKQQGQGGRIINLSSIAGRLARTEDTIYPIAKQGVEALVRALAVEFGPDGITSNGIAPGTFATESNELLARDPIKGPQVIGRNPLQRWAEPHEIAGAAVFLASNSASYVNGHILVVDGGFSIAF